LVNEARQHARVRPIVLFWPYQVVTARLVKTLDIQHIFPMHCSGSNFVDLAKKEMPGALAASSLSRPDWEIG